VTLHGGTWDEATAAIRDILWLYRDLTQYLGFCGDHETGSFRPWRWLECELDQWRDEDDVQLLQEGSAVALLCEFTHILWDGGGAAEVATYEGALRTGRFDHLPAARAAVEAGVYGTDAAEFHARAEVVYEEYVLGFFARLAAARREPPG
jgi:hypothetical protein